MGIIIFNVRQNKVMSRLQVFFFFKPMGLLGFQLLEVEKW
jgi:hypothetical protein